MAETLARTLIRVIGTIAILAAVYFFAIKPILDTTNDTIDRAFAPLDGIGDEIQSSFDAADFGGFDINDVNLEDKSQKQAQELLDCIQRVQPNTKRMQACVDRFQR